MIKKNLYQSIVMLIGMIIGITACSSSSSREEGADNANEDQPLKSLVIRCGDSYFQRPIDQTTRIISFSGIQYSTEITEVTYQLAEGAIISPDPKEVTVWKSSQEFTVTTRSGAKVVYTVRLPDLQETSSSDKVVIAYLPVNDTNFDTQFGNIHWEYLTHVNISFVHAKEDGTLNADKVPENKIDRIRTEAHSHGVKVLISINKNSSGEFRTAISNATTREKLAQNIVAYTKENRLDGFDIDYEDYNNWDNVSLAAFAKALHDAKDEEMLMTCAVICWQKYTGEWQQYFDYINIMSYDYVMGSNSSTPGQHATYEKFVSDLERWRTTEEAPKAKIIGGLPFYGYSWDDDMSKDNVGAVRFHKIIDFFTGKGHGEAEVADADHIDDTYYNGRLTIRKKCRYVMENDFGGVMIWQIFQDARQEELQLIKVIGEEILQK